MVSLKDIAGHCGVSVATVSKALNGQSDISAETRERICAAAEEMGYMANAAARALKTRRSYNIGVLFVDQRSSGLAHEYFSAVLDSLRVEAEQNGYDITFINRNVGKRPTSYLQHCLHRGVDGVVIASVDFSDPMVAELAQSNLPVVTIDHVFPGRCAVLSDNTEGMRSLVRYALRRGHRDVALIHGELTSVTGKRLAGFREACEEAQLRIPAGRILQGAYHDSDTCYRLTKQLLSAPPRPTCIFFPDDFSAIGGMNAIREAGLRIPEDISILGYDGIRLSQMYSPKLATWKQDTAALGASAAAELIALIEQPGTAPEIRTVPGSLIEGESVDLRF
ncbi:MAG: LacI family transcriptional regulator [Oscillospiraceae bacterium]|nr:LacI family transcriptional regulator [Oscillospiraceae bacterium]